MKKYIPRDATIAITFACNSRCQMCSIWQIKNPPSIPLEHFKNLSPHLRHINISGGEPFMRSDVPEIIKIVKKTSPKAQIIISSNGYSTELTCGNIEKILEIDPDIGVRISLDGIGETHNIIRGYPDFYDRVIATIDRLKEMGVKNLGFSFTIMDYNVDDMIAVYELSKKKNLQLALALVQNSDFYFHKSNNQLTLAEKIEKNLDYIIGQELKSWNPKRWLRAYYDYGLKYYLIKQQRLLKSGAGFDSLFIDPNGDIYPSNLIDLKMGNLGEGKLDELWTSNRAQEVRQEIKDKKISESWIICTVRGEMKKHLPQVGLWILRNKFF